MGADLLQGKKGSGKSKLGAMWIRERLMEGRLVATNLDLYLDKLMPPMSRATVLRVPDKPTLFDLEAIGHGTKPGGDRYNEDHNGLLLLDELATWLNARSFADKERGPVLSWFVHSRKKNWDTVCICQDIGQIDRQFRESQVDYVTRCIRMDRMRIPVFGGLIAALFGPKAGYLPRMHVATRRLGVDPKGLKAQGWMYTDGGVQTGYDTLQEFYDNYPHGPHSLLSAWHLVGRHQPEPASWWRRLLKGGLSVRTAPRRQAPLKPKLPEVEALMGLPPDDRVRALRGLSLVTYNHGTTTGGKHGDDGGGAAGGVQGAQGLAAGQCAAA